MMTGNQTQDRYIDHPAPSVGLMTLLIVGLCGLIAGLPCAVADLPADDVPAFLQPLVTAVIVLGLGVIFFYFWPLYS
ncbi:MAG: hypothetical protein V1790_07260, partial [Planctomycetota bacterium]